jgi:hypothetical protein
MKNPPDDNKSRIPYSEGSLPHKNNFLKFKHETVIKMKNKPDPALLRPSNLSNEIKKRVPKSRETIPLRQFKALKQHFNALEMYLLSFKVHFQVIFGVQKQFFVNNLLFS